MKAYHVEKGEVLLLLDDVAQLSPLRLGRVDTGRVLPSGTVHREIRLTHVGTGVQQNLRVSEYLRPGAGRTIEPSGAAWGQLRSSHIRQRATHLNVRLHALKVESDGLGVKVLVRLDLEARVLGDGDVVAPCGRGEVDGLGAGVVSSKEGGSDSEGTRSGDGLRDGELGVSRR